MSRYTSSVSFPPGEEPPRRLDPSGYLNLDKEGVRIAMAQRLIHPWGSPNGMLCLRCGALVAGTDLHDRWHETAG